MKALRKLKEGQGNVELVETAEPTLAENEVKIKVAYVGVCGTDIKILHGDAWSNPPVTLGHELAGTVEAIGSKVTTVKVGDKVVPETAQVICGKCYYCRTGNYLMCKERLSIGYGVNGGMAEYCVVREDIVHKLPKNLSMEEGALCEPLAVAVHAVYDSVNILSTDVAVVEGSGAIGLLVAQVAKSLGATVIITGLNNDIKRLEAAKEIGIDYTVNIEKDSLEELVENITNGRGADIVFECSGSAPAIRTGMSILKKMGKLVQIGLTRPSLEIEYSLLTAKEISLIGTFGHKWISWETALTLMSLGKIKVTPLITHHFGLSEWQQAFKVAEEAAGIKVLIDPSK